MAHNEYGQDELRERLYRIYEEIKKEGRVTIHGNLRFEVVDQIDNKKTVIAQLRGNTIRVRRDAMHLPNIVLKYIVAHELAHIAVKSHSARFWEMVSIIYPEYRLGKDLLEKRYSWIWLS